VLTTGHLAPSDEQAVQPFATVRVRLAPEERSRAISPEALVHVLLRAIARQSVGGGGVSSSAARGAMSQTDARSGELPLIGSLGCWRSTRFRLALPGPNGG
jgi:hypothetical protein